MLLLTSSDFIQNYHFFIKFWDAQANQSSMGAPWVAKD